jgi:hypothetical protein
MFSLTSGKMVPAAFGVPETFETAWTPIPPLNFATVPSLADTADAKKPTMRNTKVGTQQFFFMMVPPLVIFDFLKPALAVSC